MISRSAMGPTRVPRSSLGRRLAVLAVASLALSALLGATSVTLGAEKTEITICHATNSNTNPYVTESPAINSSGAFAGELAGGHNDHTGPIWFLGIDEKWGDIIPPYEYEPTNFSYPGLNWTAEGQAIYENGCQAPDPADPGIHVEKSADPTTLDFGGGPVTYTYLVTNTGNVPLSNVTIDDDKCSQITGPTGDGSPTGVLELEETWTYECTMDVGTTTTNVVDVTGTFEDVTVDDSDQATVTVLPEPDAPDINVVKTANPTSLGEGGGSVTYTYVVTNPGNVALSNVTIEDDKCAPISGPTGDANTNDDLDVGETWTYTCTMNVTVTTTNVVVVEGTPGEGNPVTSTDDATVIVDDVAPAEGTPSPSPTLPSTSTIDGADGQDGGSPLALLMILLGAGAAGVVVASPAVSRIRR